MIYQSETGDIRMVFAGETMLSRPLSPFVEPDYLAAVALTRDADMAFTNLETAVRERDEGAATLERVATLSRHHGAKVLIDGETATVRFD